MGVSLPHEIRVDEFTIEPEEITSTNHIPLSGLQGTFKGQIYAGGSRVSFYGRAQRKSVEELVTRVRFQLVADSPSVQDFLRKGSRFSLIENIEEMDGAMLASTCTIRVNAVSHHV
jgi:hypothetical protein